MNTISIILSIVMVLAMIIWVAPGIFAFNRGKALRNIALWLAIFSGLALIYKNFGPDSPHPLFSLPAGMVRHAPGESTNDKADTARPDDDKSSGSHGFTPPAE